MILHKPYPEEKRVFLLSQSDNEFRAFFNEISHPEKNKLTKILPAVSGVRPKKQLDYLERRFITLIQDAKSSETSSKSQKAWKRISGIWMAWIHSHSILQECLENYDNSADFEDGNIIPPNTSLDIGCFTYLAEASHTHKLPRSLIQRFYEFGYFQPDINIEFIIKNIEVPSEKMNDNVNTELTFDKLQVLHDLQVRVTQIETNRTKQDGSDQEFIKPLVEKSLVEVKQGIDNVIKRVSALENNYEKLENQLSVFETLPNQVEKLSQAVNAINLQLDMTVTTIDLDGFKQDVEKLEKTLLDKVEILSQKIADMPLKSALDNLKQQVSKLEKELAEQGELLFDELEQHNTTAPSNENTGYVAIQTGLYSSHIELSDAPKILSSKEDLIGHLTCNLKAAAGLIKGSAKKLAKEILAGLAAGELIVFSGSLAFNIAQVCTQALAAKQAPTVIHIPIGLLNGQQFSDYLWRAIKKAKMSEHVCAIIIEGINRSALESYAVTLRQMITQRLLGQTDLAPHIVFFGTLVEGVATLPVPVELCELGPIFNTDVLGWRSQLNTTVYEGGAIPTQDWQSWMTTDDKAVPLEKELNEAIDNPIFYPSQLWQLCVRQAYCYLVYIFDDSEESILNSLAFGWFIPRAVAAEQDWMEIKEWLLEDVFPEGLPENEKRIDKLLRRHLKSEK
ncbi:MAG: hypothetical protein VSS75_018315 [Candidatus Parabeggiatoa sp.]|nr:hypothetical protein [Candidatus Parabeggiatoa sp.]